MVLQGLGDLLWSSVIDETQLAESPERELST